MVRLNLETERFGDSLFLGLHGFTGKLDDLAARITNEMMMMCGVESVLKAGNTVIEHDFPGQAGFGDEFHRAVNGGIPDFLVLPFDHAKQVIHGDMLVGTEKCFQNQGTLFGSLKSRVPDKVAENLMRVRFHNLSQ